MLNLKKIILAVSIITCSSTYANEAERDYSLSNFNYDSLDVNIGISNKQISTNLTKTIHPNAHVSIDANSDADNKYSLGVGLNFHAPVTDWADIHGGIKTLYLKDDTQEDGLGWAFELGYRQWLSPQVEAFTSLQWDYMDETSIGGRIGALFHATSDFSIGTTFGINEISGNTLLLSTKYEF